MNQEVQVYLHQVVREDAHLLYGFANRRRETALLNLISVSGLDLSQLWPSLLQTIMQALSKPSKARTLPTWTKFPKIGKKTAQQMVLDLEGKINLDLEDAPAQSKAKATEENQALEEAMEAMLALGLQGNGTQENQEIL